MGRALLDHLPHCTLHALHRAERRIAILIDAPQAVEVAEELVRPVDEVDDQILFR
jgi:hypothetical protein